MTEYGETGPGRRFIHEEETNEDFLSGRLDRERVYLTVERADGESHPVEVDVTYAPGEDPYERARQMLGMSTESRSDENGEVGDYHAPSLEEGGVERETWLTWIDNDYLGLENGVNR